jgi:hypothetical protein
MQQPQKASAHARAHETRRRAANQSILHRTYSACAEGCQPQRCAGFHSADHRTGFHLNRFRAAN